LLVGVTAEVGAEEFVSGEWMVQATEDPLTDEFRFGMLNFFDNSNALAIRYWEDSLEIFITTEYLGTDYDEYFQTVMYRFDKNEVVESPWSISSNDKGLFFQENDTDTKQDFIEKLMIHEELVIGYWPYNENRRTIVYDLTGFTAGITPYLIKIGLSDLE